MPEIAEVETVRRVLKKEVINRTIMEVEVIYPKMIESNKDEFKERLLNQKFIDIQRLGKWLIFELDDYYLLSHLRMEGKFFIKNSNEDIVKHEHIIFSLDNKKDLRYHDTRKFGKMILSEKNNLKNLKEIQKQGIEANSDDLNADYLKEKLKGKNLAIKSALLDQTIISGLGNIYVNEVLFASKINPTRKSSSLTLKELEQVVSASKKITNEAIEMGGTTIKSYTSSLGVTGRFQQRLKVQNREGKECLICSTKIEKIKVGGRGTYYCPNCQK